MKYDFAGYATRNDMRCSDGRIIRDGAFKECDGMTVPLLWMHQHNDSANVLGHALLEYRPGEGMYTYGVFNDTERGRDARTQVENGDITALSIFANQLQQQGPNVLHGNIREVSLVLAGANPGAYIDSVVVHGDEEGEAGVIYTGEEFSELSGELELTHADKSASVEEEEEETMPAKANSGKTIGEIFDTLTEEQKQAVYAIIGYALENPDGEDNEEDNNVKHNVFSDSNEYNGDATGAALTHSQLETILRDGKQYGSLKESFLAHADEYGIADIDYLFPEARNLNNPPEIIRRDNGWVSTVMSGVHHTPFSRIKSQYADITEDEARAKGYLKGRKKKEEVFGLLKRQTTPTTVYKKQKLDRDDVIDITDFDVVSFMKTEMRGMLDEELARAYLIGDGRSVSSDDKINELNIRPIAKDDDLYTIKHKVVGASGEAWAHAFITSVIRARKKYRGSGNPTMFTTETVLTECLLLEDGFGHKLYKTEEELATAMRVNRIVTCEPMESVNIGTEDAPKYLYAVIVNLNDYNVGADKGGAVSMFDDFDIDYNQMKYLIETRCSGALIKPFSAISMYGDVDIETDTFSSYRTAAIEGAGGGGYAAKRHQEMVDNGQIDDGDGN